MLGDSVDTSWLQSNITKIFLKKKKKERKNSKQIDQFSIKYPAIYISFSFFFENAFYRFINGEMDEDERKKGKQQEMNTHK